MSIHPELPWHCRPVALLHLTPLLPHIQKPSVWYTVSTYSRIATMKVGSSMGLETMAR